MSRTHALLLVGLIGCGKAEPSPVATVTVAPEPPPPTAPASTAPPRDPMASAKTAAEAVALAKPGDVATDQGADTGTVRFARWSADHLTWSDVAKGKNETTFAVVMKDPDPERGKALCVGGRIVQISVVRGSDPKVYDGILERGNDVYSFVAVLDGQHRREEGRSVLRASDGPALVQEQRWWGHARHPPRRHVRPAGEPERCGVGYACAVVDRHDRSTRRPLTFLVTVNGPPSRSASVASYVGGMGMGQDEIDDLEADASCILRTAGLDEDAPPSMDELTAKLLGEPPLRVPLRALRWNEGALWSVDGRLRVFVANEVPAHRARWVAGHELAHWWHRVHLRAVEDERRCDALGAMLAAPRRAVLLASRLDGCAFSRVAKRLRCPEALALLRLAEVGQRPAAFPRRGHVVVRGEFPWPRDLRARSIDGAHVVTPDGRRGWMACDAAA